MERKIGEIFEYNGEWYQCVEGVVCLDCSFSQDGCTCDINGKLNCTRKGRNDDKSVVFKKLEKVGEPYAEGNSIVSERMFQKYRTYEKNFFLNERDLLFTSYGDIVSIEIKQNQEDMEEKKLNLKPFDLKKAKEGKPVCTRDGRKTRILCYDFKQNEEYPILVAVENKDGKECALLYSNDGVSEMYKSSNNELAMLPEKKEGWVNIIIQSNEDSYTGNRIYKSKEEAVDGSKDILCKEVITTKIQWEE